MRWRAIVVEKSALEGRNRETTYRGEGINRDICGDALEHCSLEALLLSLIQRGWVKQPLQRYVYHHNLHKSIASQATLHSVTTTLKNHR
jgi:hypothetical protein